jgi:hypothetical protein
MPRRPKDSAVQCVDRPFDAVRAVRKAICGASDHLTHRSSAEAVDAIGRSYGAADDERVRRERVRDAVADETAVDKPKDGDGGGRRPTPREDDRLGARAFADPRDRGEVRRSAEVRPWLLKAVLMNLGPAISDARASNNHRGTVSRLAPEHRHAIPPAVAVDVANERRSREGTARVDVRAATRFHACLGGTADCARKRCRDREHDACCQTIHYIRRIRASDDVVRAQRLGTEG